MKRHWIEYHETQPRSPMTGWVHRRVAARDNLAGEIVRDPPLPAVIGGRGYPEFHVEYHGFTFSFASFAEIRTCVQVLGQRNLPRSVDLSMEQEIGPNRHWLSRLPAKVKPWKYREKAVAYLTEALTAFERELSSRS